jgi:hypothetical protein
MIVVGSISAAFLLIPYFKKINGNYFKEGIIVGLTWFGMNILLDLLVLIPMSGMPFTGEMLLSPPPTARKHWNFFSEYQLHISFCPQIFFQL